MTSKAMQLAARAAGRNGGNMNVANATNTIGALRGSNMNMGAAPAVAPAMGPR